MDYIEEDIEDVEEYLEDIVLEEVSNYIENDITQIYSMLRQDFVYRKNDVEFVEEDLQLLEIIDCEIFDMDIQNIEFNSNINNIKNIENIKDMEVKFHLSSIINTFDNKHNFLLRITIQSIKGHIIINEYKKVKLLNIKYDGVEYDDLRCI